VYSSVPQSVTVSVVPSATPRGVVSAITLPSQRRTYFVVLWVMSPVGRAVGFFRSITWSRWS
jgi:hypothetical protein